MITYKLKWKNEIIEENIKDKKTSIYLQQEYNLAYNGGVTIHQERLIK